MSYNPVYNYNDVSPADLRSLYLQSAHKMSGGNINIGGCSNCMEGGCSECMEGGNINIGGFLYGKKKIKNKKRCRMGYAVGNKKLGRYCAGEVKKLPLSALLKEVKKLPNATVVKNFEKYLSKKVKPKKEGRGLSGNNSLYGGARRKTLRPPCQDDYEEVKRTSRALRKNPNLKNFCRKKSLPIVMEEKEIIMEAPKRKKRVSRAKMPPPCLQYGENYIQSHRGDLQYCKKKNIGRKKRSPNYYALFVSELSKICKEDREFPRNQLFRIAGEIWEYAKGQFPDQNGEDLYHSALGLAHQEFPNGVCRE